jgi:type IV fimbrial biogenesis protein FimT
MRSNKSRQATRGFTLIELMVTIAVLVVLMAVGVPSMADFSANNRVAAAKSGFASAVALARTEAARRGVLVFIKAEAGGSTGNEFSGGWSVVVDTNGSGLPDTGDEVMRKYPALQTDVKLAGTSPLGFAATGYLDGGGTRDFLVCRTSGSTSGFKVSVVPSGIADTMAYTGC